MELMAAIEALNALKKPCHVQLYTDSNYVRDGITKWIHGWRRNGWKTADKKPVKNAELWQALLDATAPHRIDWHWVKGHAGHPENERADALACAEAEKRRREQACDEAQIRHVAPCWRALTSSSLRVQASMLMVGVPRRRA